jgi:Domain of unknown function (DUF1918)
MALRVGDRVEELARSTTRPGRVGVIQTVVHGDPAPRYLIRWDDGRETVYTPAAGSLHLQSSGSGRQPRRRGAKTTTKKTAAKAPTKKTASRAPTKQPATKAAAKTAGKTSRTRKPPARKSR